MKVSSIIKTPVKATQFNGGTASVRAENGSGVIVASTMTHEFGHAIAHAINSHDPLVDMVKELRGELLLYYAAQRYQIKDDDVVRRADELLKEEE